MPQNSSDPPPDAPALPPTCNVLGLVCFGPGLHKGTLYTPEMCDRIAPNFRRLAGHTTPRAKVDGSDPGAKIGHDRQQMLAERLKRSMGFLSVGKVTRCDPVLNYPGYVEIDIRGVPTRAVGGEIAADRLPGTSVELLPRIADPNDPAQTIDGPILTGIAFLGEEQPAVRNWPPELRARARPRATFDDGRPVPANADIPQEWIDAQADVTRQLAEELGGEFSADGRTARIRGRVYADRTLCFSDITELTPMDPKAQLAALGLTPEQIEQVMKICGAPATPATNADALPAGGAGGPAPVNAPAPMSAASGIDKPPAPAAAMSDDKDMPPWAKEMSAKFAAFADDCTKRIGAIEKMSEEAQKKDDEAKMAAFSAHCEERIKSLARKLEPAFIDSVIRPAVKDIAASKTFAAETDRVKAFSDLVGRYEKMPDDPRLAAAAQPAVPPPTAATNPILAAMTQKGGILDRLNPELAKKHRAGAA